MADRTDRVDRDRKDRDRNDRDRNDRDRNDRDRNDRDRKDRDRSDRPRTPPGGGEKARYDPYDQAPEGRGEKTRYDYDKPSGGDKTSSAPRYDYDRAPGPDPSYTTTGVPPTKTRSDGGMGFAPVPILTDAGYRPQDPNVYPPPGTQVPYGQPPPGRASTYPLPPQSSGLSSYPGPGTGPLPPAATGANGTYYANNYQPPVETLSGPAAGSIVSSAVGLQPAMNHINPVPLPTSGTPLPLAVTTSSYQSPPLQTLHGRTESSVREYVNLQRQRNMVLKKGTKNELIDVENRLRSQAASALAELRVLKTEINGIVASAEGQRWRRWFFGGIFASFVPLVKKLFRKPKEERNVNKTEYAFRKSKSLVDRILASTKRPGIATVAFFVFAVLYIFSNEVSLRVSRTVSKRLKRLTSKIESGEGDISEEDLKALQGWRWRVLMWLD